MTKYATMNNQNFPVRPRWWGSGGGSPLGRRRGGTRAGMRGWSSCAGSPAGLVASIVIDSPRRPTLPRRDREAVRHEPSARHVGRRAPRRPSRRSSRAGRDVRSNADTAFSASASRGPNVSSAACETTGVTFSEGCRSRSSSRSTRPPARSAGSLENSSPMSIVPSLRAWAVRGPPASSGMYSLKCKPYTSSSPLRQRGRCSHSAGPPNVIPGANDVRSLNRSTLRLAAVVPEIAKELRSSAGAALNAVSPRGASWTASSWCVVAGSLEAVPPMKPRRLPAYSGTSSTKPRCSAGISSSRGPTLSSRCTRKPRASSVCA